jgi:ribosomal protein S7
MELRKTNSKYLYNSIFIKKFVNGLAKAGKIQVIERAIFESLANLKFKVYLNPLVLFLFLLNEIKPCIILKSLRLGSVVYQIPMPLSFRKQFLKSIKLLINTIKISKQSESIEKKIETELILLVQGKSFLYKTSFVLYQTASNARAFAHYRWD